MYIIERILKKKGLIWKMTGYLLMENGEVFEGERIGAHKEAICEIVFNTSMAGYLEIFTDPSYAGQGVVLTYPLIGNYGAITKDEESRKAWVEAVFLHELAPVESNFRSEMNLNDYLLENDIPGLQGINTRKLTKILRKSGTMKGMLTDDLKKKEELIKKLQQTPLEKNLVRKVTTKEIETAGKGELEVALFNFGSKRNIVKSLTKRNCKVTVFPAETKAEEILKGNFDGIVLSNGPGDPEECKEEIQEIKKLYETDIPILGICLGHQLMGLATGCKTAKLRYGHRGPNQPVKDLKADRVYITSQNHGYYIEENSVNPEIAEVSHINLNDNTVEGLRYKNKEIVTVQFHPEACPGPEDTAYLFDEFVKVMEERKNATK